MKETREQLSNCPVQARKDSGLVSVEGLEMARNNLIQYIFLGLGSNDVVIDHAKKTKEGMC